MGLPSTRDLSFIDNSLPAINAAVLNKLQDLWVLLTSGTSSTYATPLSWKQLIVDGVGNVATALSGVIARLDNAAGDTNGIGETTKTPTARYCFWRWQVATNIWGRLYLSPSGIEITVNAVWGGATWTQDTGGAADNSFRFKVEFNGVTVEWKLAGSGAWADGAWGAVGSMIGSTGLWTAQGGLTATAGNLLAQGSASGQGNVKAQGSNAGDGYLQAAGAISSATPGAGQAVPLGAIFKDTTIVAWALTQSNGTVTASANLASSPSHVAASGVYGYTLTNAPTHFGVVPVLQGGAGYAKGGSTGATTFQIDTYSDLGTTHADLSHFVLIIGG